MLVLHSLGGGTGSGLGSYALELLRDEICYKSSIVSCCVGAKSGSNEVCIQAYNSVLSVSSNTRSADMVLLYDNSELS